jgi:hypothetical protein
VRRDAIDTTTLARARVVVRVDASQSHAPVGPTGRSRARFWTTTDYHYLK